MIGIKSRGLRNTWIRYPDYYRTFTCTGSACSDTCCACWGISVDRDTMRRYLSLPGELGDRMRRSIDRKTGSFQMQNGRCPFLNQENLCELILKQGEDLLCDTCRRYPRHVEVYGPLRELSLSLSCPEAVKLILGGEKRTRLITKKIKTQRPLQRSGHFIRLLLSVRSEMFRILSDRRRPIDQRMALILTLSHDVQHCLERKNPRALRKVMICYRTYGSADKSVLTEGLRLYEKQTATVRRTEFQVSETWRSEGQIPDIQVPVVQRSEAHQERKRTSRRDLLCLYLEQLSRLEPVVSGWRGLMEYYVDLLYGPGMSGHQYEQNRSAFEEAYGKRNFALDAEHLLSYFLYSYLMGAYYDKQLETKVKMSVVSCLVILEMGLGAYVEKGSFSRDDMIEAAHRFSRELEHSDYNLEKMERMMGRYPGFGVRQILGCILDEEGTEILEPGGRRGEEIGQSSALLL